MSTVTDDVIRGLMAAFSAKDLEGALAFFAEDAVVNDPHYPIPKMSGSDAIRQGFAWAFGNMKQPGFAIRQVWDNGRSGAVELDTRHVFKAGVKSEFEQVFVFELNEDGKIKRLQSYVPYRPPGIGGVLVKIIGWIWRLRTSRGRNT